MTEEEIRKIEAGYSEAKIQHTCVEWYRSRCKTWFAEVSSLNFDPRLLLYAVPNGGQRSKASAGMRKYEGVVPGVADLIFQCGSNDGEFCYLAIEMKTMKGSQSSDQKKWERVATLFGGKYVICRSIIDFCKIMCEYVGKDYDKELSILLFRYPTYLGTAIDVDKEREKLKRFTRKLNRGYGKRLDQD